MRHGRQRRRRRRDEIAAARWNGAPSGCSAEDDASACLLLVTLLYIFFVVRNVTWQPHLSVAQALLIDARAVSRSFPDVGHMDVCLANLWPLSQHSVSESLVIVELELKHTCSFPTAAQVRPWSGMSTLWWRVTPPARSPHCHLPEVPTTHADTRPGVGPGQPSGADGGGSGRVPGPSVGGWREPRAAPGRRGWPVWAAKFELRPTDEPACWPLERAWLAGEPNRHSGHTGLMAGQANGGRGWRVADIASSTETRGASEGRASAATAPRCQPWDHSLGVATVLLAAHLQHSGGANCGTKLGSTSGGTGSIISTNLKV